MSFYTIILWIIGLFLGFILLVALCFGVSYWFYYISKRRLERGYTQEKDYGRRIEQPTTPVRESIRPSSPGSLQPINNIRITDVKPNSERVISNVERIKRAFGKAQ